MMKKILLKSGLILILHLLLNTSLLGGEYELDKYGGWTGLKGTQTGYFHFEKIDDRYWFITPDGNVFFAVALSHMLSGESDLACEKLFNGDRYAWHKAAYQHAKEMGFNCALGSATSPERNLNGFVDVEFAESLFRKDNFPFAVGVILLKHPWEFVDGETLPDIYEPSYKALIESRAAEVCPKYKDDPLVMGYYYGFGAFNHSDAWVGHHMSMPPGSAGREAISDLLINRYDNDVDAFNDVYGLSLQSMAELKDKHELTYDKAFDRRNYPAIRKTLDARMLGDFEAIISDMCIRLYKIAHDAIRKYDDNHLIFGSFIKEWALSEESWREVAKYVDLISPQHYNEHISINEFGHAVNMPIIASDDYFGFHYPGGTGTMHAALVSHDARGEVYRASMYRHLKDRQMIGVTYCACMYDQGGNTLEKNLQNGFIGLDGQPRESLIEAVTAINNEIYEHAQQPGTAKEMQALHDDLWGKWKQFAAKRKRPNQH